MAGGTWEIQNKSLPGLYYKVVSNKPVTPAVGVRGTVALALPLSWGEGLLEVTSNDMLTGDSLYKIGLSSTDEGAKILNEIFKYCTKAYIYNTNTGGTASTATIGDLKVTAKHSGILGNRITVSIVAKNSKYAVNTFIDSDLMDTQTVGSIEELHNNDYVIFEDTTAAFSVASDGDISIRKSKRLTANAGTKLTGGSDGTKDGAFLDKFLKAIKTKKWDVLGGISIDTGSNSKVISFIKQMRDELGKYVQAVLKDADAPNYEGIISVKQGYKTKNYEITAEEFPAVVAAMTAGANFNESNTMRVVLDATEIINEIEPERLEEEVNKGWFLLNYNALDQVAVVKDINSLTSFTVERSYAFSKNRVIRTLDIIGTDLRIEFETKYAGKIDNNEEQRSLFKGSIISYLTNLVTLGAIENFDDKDIIVEKGEEIDSVYVELSLTLVDSMEKIYMKVVVM